MRKINNSKLLNKKGLFHNIILDGSCQRFSLPKILLRKHFEGPFHRCHPSGIYETSRLQSSESTSSLQPHREFPAATSTFSGLVIMFIISLLGMSNTYASSISISLTGNVSLNLIKSNTEAVFGKSTTQTATVTSDHFTGYTLTIAGSNDTGRLVGANDSTKYLSSIPNAMSESTFNTDAYNDMWGFLPSKLNSVTNNIYQPSPTASETTIDVTNSPNTNETDYTLALAARVSNNMSLDSYGQTFVLAATGNGYDYHIGFSDVMETLPDDMYGNTQSDTVALPATTPTKAGYTFAGWCDVKPTVSINGTTCPAGAHTYPAGYNNFPLNGDSANNVELFAIWSAVTFDKAFSDAEKTKVGNYYAMQDMTSSICNAVAIGQEGTLVDNRADKKTYTVGKLKDGRCWMLDNLALGGSSTIALKTTDTNISSDWTLPASTTSGFDTYTVARINTAYNNTVPTDAMSTAGGWKVGTYYNYCAAKAGTYCPASNVTVEIPQSDICPKGWRMPSGGLGGEYQILEHSYDINYNDLRSAAHFPLSGAYVPSGLYKQNTQGFYWSNTFKEYNHFYNMDIYTNGSFSLGVNNRQWGLSVRCIAK